MQTQSVASGSSGSRSPSGSGVATGSGVVTHGSVSNAPVLSGAAAQPQDSHRLPKLPAFFDADVQLWFMQVEELLRNHGEGGKKQALLLALPTSVVQGTGIDLSLSFASIKEDILRYYQLSSQLSLKTLLRESVLGDRRPSVALRQRAWLRITRL